MKNLIFLFVCLFAGASVFAQNAKYTAAMTKALAQLDSAETPAQQLDAANSFARVASAEPKEWLPNYYAAFSMVSAAFSQLKENPAKALETIDAAQANLDKATAIAPNESEIVTLQAYILIARVSENPMVKGQELSPQVFATLGKAMALNPQNPRAPFLQGMYTLNMPEFYGGGAARAKPLFEKAATLFEQPVSDALLPNWGKETNAYFLGETKK
jgi:multidrug efflux pump subunit AcrA (membrane-fusion protein)